MEHNCSIPWDYQRQQIRTKVCKHHLVKGHVIWLLHIPVYVTQNPRLDELSVYSLFVFQQHYAEKKTCCKVVLTLFV